MSNLRGMRILLVEDEEIVATLVEDMFESLGCTIAGRAATIRQAMEFIEQGGFEFALLDLNIAGEKVEGVAEALESLDIPVAFASGYGRAGLSSRFRSHPSIRKPFVLTSLKQWSARHCGRSSIVHTITVVHPPSVAE